MTTRYQKQHYEDVADIISFEMGIHPERPNRTPTLRGVARAFADLFAADNPNPDACLFCGEPRGPDPLCFSRDTPDTGHSYTDGFNREQFLAACGLESGG